MMNTTAILPEELLKLKSTTAVAISDFYYDIVVANRRNAQAHKVTYERELSFYGVYKLSNGDVVLHRSAYSAGMRDITIIGILYKGQIVGFFRYRVMKWKRRGVLYMETEGTWVHKDHRRSGLATFMWDNAIKHSKIQEVEMSIVTEEGLRFIDKMRFRHPHLKWNIAVEIDD